MSFLEGDSNRISHTDLEAEKQKYQDGINKPRKITKSEKSICGPDIPAEMGGCLKKKDIQLKYDKEIRAEIEFRRLKYPKGEDGKRKAYKNLTMAEKKELLINDEMGILAVELKAREGIKLTDAKSIVPQSR